MKIFLLAFLGIVIALGAAARFQPPELRTLPDPALTAAVEPLMVASDSELRAEAFRHKPEPPLSAFRLLMQEHELRHDARIKREFNDWLVNGD
jgi:hypothetical protein